jgi:hypothetical protein
MVAVRLLCKSRKVGAGGWEPARLPGPCTAQLPFPSPSRVILLLFVHVKAADKGQPLHTLP